MDFDKLLIEVLDVWLGASSTNHELRQIFKACDIKTYLMFHMMEKDSVAALERVITQAPTKLREVHSIGINEILMFIQFLETIDMVVADDPNTWKIEDYRQWKIDGKPSNVTITSTTLLPTGNIVASAQNKQQKVDNDMPIGWKRTRKDAKGYPVLNKDEYYTEWLTQILRQIKMDGRERSFDPNFLNSSVQPGSDSDLLDLRLVFMSQVMEKVLLNVKEKKLVRSYKKQPRTLWKVHRVHQTSSTTAQSIAIDLSNKLSTMTIASAASKCAFLEAFDTAVEKYDEISPDKMHSSHKIGLLKKACLPDKDLLQAWTAVEQIFINKSTGTAITYEEYWDYLVSVLESLLEKGIKDKVHQKVNVADTSYYMDSYIPDDSYYDEAADLSTYMGELGDVDALQYTLQCNKAMREGRLKPKPKLRRERRSIRPELQIKGQL